MTRRPKRCFDTLLRVRKRKEDMQARLLAELRREADMAERQREELMRARRRALHEAGRRASGTFDAGEARRYYQYERHLAERTVAKDAELHALRDRSEVERASLEAAMKERRMVERLIERREALWRRDLDRAEQKLLDETGSTRAARSVTDDAAHGWRENT